MTLTGGPPSETQSHFGDSPSSPGEWSAMHARLLALESAISSDPKLSMEWARASQSTPIQQPDPVDSDTEDAAMVLEGPGRASDVSKART
jgi:hypothetical protein